MTTRLAPPPSDANLVLAESVEGWMSRDEIALLHDLSARVAREPCVVEIGNYRGRSTVALALGARDGRGADFEAWRPHLAPGAVVAFDDCDFGDVARCVAERVAAGELAPHGGAGKVRTFVARGSVQARIQDLDGVRIDRHAWRCEPPSRTSGEPCGARRRRRHGVRPGPAP